MSIDLLVHTDDPAQSSRAADRRSNDRRFGTRERRRAPRHASAGCAGRPTASRSAPPNAIPEGRAAAARACPRGPLPARPDRRRPARRHARPAVRLGPRRTPSVAGPRCSCPFATVFALEAGDLYDRDDLVLRRSTLDEAPMLCCSPRWRRSSSAAIGGRALEPVVLVEMWLMLGIALVASRSSCARPSAAPSCRNAAWWSAMRSWRRTCAARSTTAAPPRRWWSRSAGRRPVADAFEGQLGLLDARARARHRPRDPRADVDRHAQTLELSGSPRPSACGSACCRACSRSSAPAWTSRTSTA